MKRVAKHKHSAGLGRRTQGSGPLKRRPGAFIHPGPSGTTIPCLRRQFNRRPAAVRKAACGFSLHHFRFEATKARVLPSGAALPTDPQRRSVPPRKNPCSLPESGYGSVRPVPASPRPQGRGTSAPPTDQPASCRPWRWQRPHPGCDPSNERVTPTAPAGADRPWRFP